MPIAGIVCEYNPFHRGHAYQLTELRRHLGADGAIVCVMSGNFVQRGDFALLNKHSRAEAAVCAGADLVLELPVCWATASAERFAEGAVGLLQATGLVDTLCFGSESGAAAPFREAAAYLCDVRFPALLCACLQEGCSFPAARQRAVERLAGKPFPLLQSPNDLLGVEYAKAMQKRNADWELLPLRRRGARHDGPPQDGYASASYLRRELSAGRDVSPYLTEDMLAIVRREQAAGRSFASSALCERAMLAQLRRLPEEALRPYDGGGEGLYHRVYGAIQEGTSLAEILCLAKTKRYTHSRLRRMLLHAYLELPTEPMPLPYLRVLAVGAGGRRLLQRMKQVAALPLILQPSQVRRCGEPACRAMELESRTTDLYALAQPTVGKAGQEWKQGAIWREEQRDGL